MPIERVNATPLVKPWGSMELSPWNLQSTEAGPIGEIWFRRDGFVEEQSSLLFKLLFTKQALSLQVHPDDSYARRNGLGNGKTEAWYILAAGADSKVGIGLTINFNKPQLLEAIHDGSIENYINWTRVKAGDVVFVPAGTIHAIGPDLVIAEIQQASDATFRLFDYGRNRPIHPQAAADIAKNTKADIRHLGNQANAEKRLLAACPYFTFVAINVPPASRWTLRATAETWLLALSGDADLAGTSIAATQALYAKNEQINMTAGPNGFSGLVATSSPTAFSTLLTRISAEFPPAHDSITRAAKRRSLPHRNGASMTSVGA